MQLEEKAKNLPERPGVYIMKDANGRVIYVGKARSLRNRVRSYFQKGTDTDPKTRAMMARLVDFDYILTSSELDALILENNLIKEHRPRYNVILRDDKNYPCLKLTVGERFPRLYLVRQIKKDDSIYFGPFTSAQALKDTLRLVYRVFGLRRCPETMLKKGRPCIYCQMKQCLAPCLENIDEEQYRQTVKRIKEFFQGQGLDVVASLSREMTREAENLNFERAAKLRDQIRSLERVLTKQRMVSASFLDQDFLGLSLLDGLAQIEVLFVRAGKVIGNQSLSLRNRRGFSPGEIISSFLKQFYGRDKFIPKEIVIGEPVEDSEAIEGWLTAKKGGSVKLLVPQKGDRAKILKMASENARAAAQAKLESEKSDRQLLDQLKVRLHLANFPQRIEGCDISNIQGSNPVGSLVVFQEGKPAKGEYRRYKIKSLATPNDYLMLYEVLTRRFSRALEEDTELPDLVLIDGGKGQLSVALQVLKELKIQGVDAVSLAKPGEEEGGEEKVYLAHAKDPLPLPATSPVMLFLKRIRDEAHRFAVTFHRKLRKKGALRSALEEIPGIGPTKRRALLRHFGSLKQVIEASIPELAGAPRMTPKDAKTVYSYLHGDQARPSVTNS